MNVKQGDVVKVNGIESAVDCFWGAGKHKVFKLKDGREILDLDKAVAAGHVSIVKQPAPAPEKKGWSV